MFLVQNNYFLLKGQQVHWGLCSWPSLWDEMCGESLSKTSFTFSCRKSSLSFRLTWIICTYTNSIKILAIFNVSIPHYNSVYMTEMNNDLNDKQHETSVSKRLSVMSLSTWWQFTSTDSDSMLNCNWACPSSIFIYLLALACRPLSIDQWF